jgi:hypothetical protein
MAGHLDKMTREAVQFSFPDGEDIGDIRSFLQEAKESAKEVLFVPKGRMIPGLRDKPRIG